MSEETKQLQISFRNFQANAYDGKNPLPVKICDPVNPDRVVRFTASDDSIDRAGDVIVQDGWDLAEWMQNPVIMQMHDLHAWPIGKGIAAGVVGNKLLIDAEFDPPEVDEDADMIWRKVKHGSVKAGSVGFEWLERYMPGSNHPNAAPLFRRYPGASQIFAKQKLIEFTICPVPMNANALVEAMVKNYAKRFSTGSEPADEAARALETANTAALLERIERMARSIS